MDPVPALEAESLERPHPRLITYYVLTALVIPPLFPILILPLFFRYHTLHYRFDREGVSMRWGILFRREVVLNYARIQDIQIRANFVERWLGLARIELQTAAGSSGAEMTLEGFLNYEAIRDFLYERMRGTREDQTRGSRIGAGAGVTPESAAVPEALTAVLREVAAELRGVRQALEKHANR
jgi:putative membrane protein